MMKRAEMEIFKTVKGRAGSIQEVTYMKSLSVMLAVILLVMGLAICYAKAWAAEWKEFAEATTGVFHYDAASIRSTPEGFVRVWIHNETKQETNLVELDCKERRYHVLDVIQYDKANRIKNRETYYDNPTPSWYDISQKSVPEPLYYTLCP
jgi:hypothetical protein